jgi:hypothetical protein
MKKQLFMGVFFLLCSITVFSQLRKTSNTGSNGQGKYYGEDYVQFKSYSLTAMFVETGLGIELRADIPYKKWIINGVIGAKASLGEDSTITTISPSKTAITLFGDHGLFYKFGIGLNIGRKEFEQEKTYREGSTRVTYNALSTTYSTTYWGYKSYTAHFLNTKYLMLDIIYLPNGKFINLNNKDLSIFAHGYNFFFSPKIRFITEENDTEETIRIIDVAFLFTPNLSQVGINSEFQFIWDGFAISLGLGAIKRNDKPYNFYDPLWDYTSNYSLYVPIKCTLGYTFMAGGKHSR